MTVEERYWVRLARTDTVDQLVRDARAALARHEKALAGDRTEAARFEALSSALEQRARHEQERGAEMTAATVALPGQDAPSGLIVDARELAGLGPAEDRAALEQWLGAGDVAVELRSAFHAGPTAPAAPAGAERKPAAPWRAEGRIGGSAAVEQRFRALVAAAAAGQPGAAVSPSGVANGVVTRVLRDFAGAMPGAPTVSAPVVYRDGSRGLPFPLRAIALAENEPEAWPPRTLSFALLSIRHTEMDVDVDGAWLRNTVVSRVRPAGDTDRIVHDVSRSQLAELTREGPVTLLMHQTGLETAIVGFYRAVLAHLAEQPRSLVVVPHFFRERSGPDGSPGFVKGQPWQTR